MQATARMLGMMDGDFWVDHHAANYIFFEHLSVTGLRA
jgi:hypothetical protein